MIFEVKKGRFAECEDESHSGLLAASRTLSDSDNNAAAGVSSNTAGRTFIGVVLGRGWD